MSSKDCCSFLRGKVYTADRTNTLSFGCNFGYSFGCATTTNSPGRSLGNITSLQINIDSEEKQNLVLNDRAYDNECGTTIINAVTFSMQISCMSCENLKEALVGNVKQIATPDPVVDQIHFPTERVRFGCGDCIFFDKVGVDESSVVVKNSVTGQVYEQNVDYCADACGIELLKDFPFPAGTGFSLSYSYDPAYKCTSIQALTGEIKPISLIYKGKNIADNNNPFIVKMHNVKLNPTSAFNLINESEFGTLEISGTLQRDKSIKGKEISQYFEVIKAFR